MIIEFFLTKPFPTGLANEVGLNEWSGHACIEREGTKMAWAVTALVSEFCSKYGFPMQILQKVVKRVIHKVNMTCPKLGQPREASDTTKNQ